MEKSHMDYLVDAFNALLAGDLAERDRLLALSQQAYQVHERLLRVEEGDPITLQ